MLDENSDFPIRRNTEINILKVPFFSKPQGKKRCNFSKKKTWVGEGGYFYLQFGYLKSSSSGMKMSSKVLYSRKTYF